MNSSYVVQRCDEKNRDRYDIIINEKVEYCYYSRNDNQFVNKVYFFVGDNYQIGHFLENSIYVFCLGVERLEGIISILKEEFFSLQYVFVIKDEKLKKDILRVASNLDLEVEFLNFQQYLK